MSYKSIANKFLDQAEEISNTKDATARFRALAYARAANIIEAKGNTKATKAGINNLPLTDYMKSKALYFFENPASKKSRSLSISRSRSTSRSPRNSSKSPSKSPRSTSNSHLTKKQLIAELSNLKGIGAERAKLLIEAGLTSMSQLKLRKFNTLLPEETKTFLSLKPLQKIPHEHIKMLEPYILKAADTTMTLILTGSYRRKKAFSSDIDVMVVSDNPNAIQNLLTRLTKILKGKVYPYSQGEDKMSLVVDMSELVNSTPTTKSTSNSKSKSTPKNIYKIDAFRTTQADKIPMLLYSTGSKEFNITMRSRAKKLGYLLNQKGLFKNGVLVPNLKSELDYFNALNMPFKEPTNRV